MFVLLVHITDRVLDWANLKWLLCPFEATRKDSRWRRSCHTWRDTGSGVRYGPYFCVVAESDSSQCQWFMLQTGWKTGENSWRSIHFPVFALSSIVAGYRELHFRLYLLKFNQSAPGAIEPRGVRPVIGRMRLHEVVFCAKNRPFCGHAVCVCVCVMMSGQCVCTPGGAVRPVRAMTGRLWLHDG